MKLLIPCPNVYGCIVEVWDEFINEFILHFAMNIITNPCWDWIWSKLEKEALGHAWSLQYTHISMAVSLAVEEVTIHPNASCCSRPVGETGVHPRLLSTSYHGVCVSYHEVRVTNTDPALENNFLHVLNKLPYQPWDISEKISIAIHFIASKMKCRIKKLLIILTQ